MSKDRRVIHRRGTATASSNKYKLLSNLCELSNHSQGAEGRGREFCGAPCEDIEQWLEKSLEAV